jgi:hypothetical protein
MTEAVALIGRTDSGNTVSERLEAFGSGPGWELTSGILSDVMRKRNQVVHRGYHHLVRDGDVQIVKSICESAILWLHKHLDEVPTREHLKLFYAYRTLPASQLDRITQKMAFVRGCRAEAPGTSR